MPGLAVYVHWPFCVRKCTYCDFNSRPGGAGERSDYLHALLDEIAAAEPADVATVYFGGGTPTVYPAEDLLQALCLLASRFRLAADAEVTVEANPGTVDREKLAALAEGGFNRISLGVQSLRDDELALLGRMHSAAEAIHAVELARRARFRSVSVDLIRGLPGQSLDRWKETVQGVLGLSPDHVSAYGLTLEEGTTLEAKVADGTLPEPEGSGDPQWVLWTADALQQAGYARYEIANYARPGHPSRHNLNYWHNGDYLGFGAGAWSYSGGERRRNVADPSEYVRRVRDGEGLTVESERLSAMQSLGESMMLGLRMTEGISRSELRSRHGIDPLEHHREPIRRLVAAGLMVDDMEQLRLTSKGLLLQNAVALEFIA